MVFDMEARIPDNSEVTMAELKLYQQASYQKRYVVEKRNHRSVSNARVSVYWVDGSNRTSLVDSRCVISPPAGVRRHHVTLPLIYASLFLAL